MTPRAVASICALGASLACKGDAPRTAPPAGRAAGSATTKEEVAPGGWRTRGEDRAAAALPGELWFLLEDRPHQVERVVAGRRAVLTDRERSVYPSRDRLSDGRVVALASRGDGSADSEQLVLVEPSGALTPIGPAAPLVRQPAVARDGTWVVVELQQGGVSNLHRIDVATGEATQLTNDPQGNFHPARLAGDDIVWVSSRDGDAELYRGSVKGGVATRLTAFHRDDFEPVPSPDGSTIAFLSDREGVAPRIFLVAADGTNLRRLTSLPSKSDDEEGEVAWSPDGARLAYVRRRKATAVVIVRDVATGRERIVTPEGIAENAPAWSPDGKWLAVVRGRDNELDIWAVPVDGGQAIQVSSYDHVERLPRWFALATPATR